MRALRTILLSSFFFFLLTPVVAAENIPPEEELTPLVCQRKTEYIESFLSDITVLPNGGLDVQESIRVCNSGFSVKQGIFRDLSTEYRGDLGLRIQTLIEILSISRDGETEPFRVQKEKFGMRIYIGDPRRILPKGSDPLYIIHYRTDRQLSSSGGMDELYWNVTGNKWQLPIEYVQASIFLPDAVPRQAIEMNVYTGLIGMQEKNAVLASVGDGSLVARTTQQLRSLQGMTMSIAWPKGYIAHSSLFTEIWLRMRDNRGLAIFIGGIFFVLFYYLMVWHYVGREPTKRTIIAQYEPPEGFSPAAVRYIWSMRSDASVFSASIIHMAIQGAIAIEEITSPTDKAGIKLIKKDASVPLFPEESLIFSNLFKRNSFFLIKKQQQTFGLKNVVSSLNRDLRRRYHGKYFHLNTKYFVPGAVFSYFLFLYAFTAEKFEFSWLMLQVLAMLIVVLIRLKRGGVVFIYQVFFAVCGIFMIIGLFLLMSLSWLTNPELAIPLPWLIGGFLSLAIMNVCFATWLQAYTDKGSELINHLEGLRIYLSIAEKSRMEYHNPPQMTAQLFEKYLPYAIALGVEHTWADRFTLIITESDALSSQTYAPLWHTGMPTAFVSGIPALLHTIDESVNLASPSFRAGAVGRGGRGFSGGGRGGTGGGGW